MPLPAKDDRSSGIPGHPNRWADLGSDANLFADTCATTPATNSTHSGHSQASDFSTDEADPSHDLNLEEFKLLISSGCAISKKLGDWPQRICDLRAICSLAEAFAYSDDHADVLEGRRDTCLREMRELSNTLAKLAQMQATPNPVALLGRSLPR